MLWIGVAFFAFLLALASKPAVAQWRTGAEPDGWRSKPVWWRRSIPTILVICWAMIIGALATPLALSQDGLLGAAFTVVLLVALIAVLLGFIAWGTVAVFGWPRSLVPPSLRI